MLCCLDSAHRTDLQRIVVVCFLAYKHTAQQIVVARKMQRCMHNQENGRRMRRRTKCTQ